MCEKYIKESNNDDEKLFEYEQLFASILCTIAVVKCNIKKRITISKVAENILMPFHACTIKFHLIFQQFIYLILQISEMRPHNSAHESFCIICCE